MRGLHRRRPARPRVDASLFLLRARNREYPIDNPKVVKALPVIESPTALRLALPLAFARLLAQTVATSLPSLARAAVQHARPWPPRKILRGRFAIVALRAQQPGHPLRRSAHAPPEILAGQPDLPPAMTRPVVRASRKMKGSGSRPPRVTGHTIYNGVPLDDVREQKRLAAGPATAPAAGTNRTRSSRSAQAGGGQGLRHPDRRGRAAG